MDACRKEVALNSETAPGLYIGVRRITRAEAGTLEFDDDGPLIDAVVEMSRFEQSQLFDRMAVAGRLTPEIMTRTARMIALYHRRAPVVSKGGGAANIESVLDINDAGFATSHVFSAAELAKLSEAFRLRLGRHSGLLDRRAVAGKVRRCHAISTCAISACWAASRACSIASSSISTSPPSMSSTTSPSC